MQSLEYSCIDALFYYTDYKAGFGGKYGIQNDRQDKSAVGWDHQEAVQKHESQKGIIYQVYHINKKGPI